MIQPACLFCFEGGEKQENSILGDLSNIDIDAQIDEWDIVDAEIEVEAN